MGPLEAIKQNLFNVHLNFIDGEHSFLGKTLILKSEQNDNMSCAIILPFENKLTYIANYRSDVQGIVYLLQSGNLFSIISSLYYSSPLEKTSFNDWAIVNTAPETSVANTFEAYYRNEINDCANINATYIVHNVS